MHGYATYAAMEQKPVLVIESGRGAAHYWRELLRYRELFLFLTWRDILVRYKQTAIGILWSIMRPLLTMLVFTFIFGKVASMPKEGTAPYALMVFAALLPWQMFSNAVQESSNSLIVNADMIAKIYFPRIIMPLSSIFTALVDFAIALAIYLVMMVFFGVIPTWHMLAMPLFLLLGLGSAVGVGLVISALNVSFRDFRYIVPFIIQFGLYISPVGFSSTAVPEKWRFLYCLNPLVGVIDGFRWSLLGQNISFYWPGLIASVCITVALIVFGVTVFRRMERTFADNI